MKEDLIVFDGRAVKALGNGKVGGHLVIFSTPDDPDLTGEYFTKDTDFDFTDGDKTSILYHHGLDPVIKGRSIGKGKLSHDDHGVWVEAQLDLRDDYERSIYALAEAGKLGWSSGTASYRIEREEGSKATWLKSWPLGIDASLTPTPAEPRTRAVPLKSLQVADESAKTLQGSQDAPSRGLTLQEETDSLIRSAEAYASRIGAYVQLKTDEGRRVSDDRREQIKSIRDRLSSILEDLYAPDRLQEMRLRLLRKKYSGNA